MDATQRSEPDSSTTATPLEPVVTRGDEVVIDLRRLVGPDRRAIPVGRGVLRASGATQRARFIGRRHRGPQRVRPLTTYAISVGARGQPARVMGDLSPLVGWPRSWSVIVVLGAVVASRLVVVPLPAPRHGPWWASTLVVLLNTLNLLSHR
jgi:hypothetical protein